MLAQHPPEEEAAADHRCPSSRQINVACPRYRFVHDGVGMATRKKPPALKTSEHAIDPEAG